METHETTTCIREILFNFREGVIDADECFCMVVSLDGYDSTRQHFLKKIDFLQLTSPQKFNELRNIYITYFEQPPSKTFTDPVGCSVENGYLSSDFGYELDIELASALSVNDPTETGAWSSYADVLHDSSAGASTSKKETKDAGVPHRSTETHITSNNITTNEIPSPGKGSKKRKNRVKTNGRGYNSQQKRPVLYWIRRDLRLYDNPALCEAASMNVPVILVYLWSELEEDPDNVVAAGGATKLWLHHALKELDKSITDAYGNKIIYRKTDSCLNEIKELVKETGCQTLVMNDIYEPFLKQRDDKICEELQKRGISCKRFHSYLLYEPGTVSTESMGMRGIGSVTHFLECCKQSSTQSIGHPLDRPGTVLKPDHYPASMSLMDLGLATMPRRKDGTIVILVDLKSF